MSSEGCEGRVKNRQGLQALSILRQMVKVFDDNPNAADLFPMSTVAKAKRLHWETKDIDLGEPQ